MRKTTAHLFLPLLLCGPWIGLWPDPAPAAQPHTLEEFLRQDQFGTIKLSPNGTYYAATVPVGDKMVAVVIRRSDMQPVGHFNLAGKTYVLDFWWATDERLLLAMGEKFGSLDAPVPTGEIYAMNADGTRVDALVGYRAAGSGSGVRTKRKGERVFASLIHALPEDEKNVLISVEPFSTGSAEVFTQVERMNIRSGRRAVMARAPVRRASFVADASGEVRFAIGAGSDNLSKTYYRGGARAEWELINDTAETGRILAPIGFGADGRTAYLQFEEATGPDAIHAFDTETRALTPALRGEYADPYRILWDPVGREPVGAVFMEGTPKQRFFDENGATARLYKSLHASFPGQQVIVASATRDGRLLLHTASDRQPGDYFLFDAENRQAGFVLAKGEWIDPERTAAMRPFSLEARDGVVLHGYLTLPPGDRDGRLPMIVHPHGGPFGIADDWGFALEPQILAAHGYAVLQVNFRGSGYYGRQFRMAGYQQWGQAMQDDVTDATRWAVAEGIADPARICIYGSSYGGYAALMGVAKEPDLYRCAVGNVGVYDMKMMYSRGDIAEWTWGKNFLKDALGRQDLEAISPTRLAGRIKAPVFLAAGGEDRRAPPEHTLAMEKALQAAGVPVKTLIFPNEGHGYFDHGNQVEYYQQLLAFLDRHIGGSVAATRASSAGAER